MSRAMHIQYYSIHRLIRDTEANFDFFSHAALRSRKEKLNLRPQDLDNYFIGLWVPDQSCVTALRRALAPHIKRYKSVYRPLRNKLYAHSLTNDPVAIQALFANTNQAELEAMLLAVREVVGLIQEMYQNGSEPVLGRMLHDSYRRECRGATTKVIEKVRRIRA
jgi:AbiU2